jgi:hypothetical protein
MFAVGSSTSNSQPVTGGEQDINENGTVTPQVSITSGSLDQSDSTTGRGTLSLTTASGTSNYVYYVVSATELLAMDIDATGPQVILDIQQQQVVGASGAFTNASLKGQGVIQLNGVDNSSGSALPTAAVGVATFDGSGNIVRTDGVDAYYTDKNDGGTVTTQSYATGTYNVDPTCGPIQSACGRVTVSLVGASTQPVWYLVNANQGFIIDTDAAATSGLMQSQTVPSQGFALLNLLGSYLGSTLTPTLASITNELDVALTPPPGGIWSYTYDSSGPRGPHDQLSYQGKYDCGGTAPGCSTTGAALGRFEITNPNDQKPLLILYVIGSGSSGTTGSKGGMIGVNVGGIASDGTTIPEANTRLTSYSR